MLRKVPNLVWAELCAFLLAIASNVAANQLPSAWKPYLWFAWPVALLVLLGHVLLLWPRFTPVISARQVGIYERAGGRLKLIWRVREFWINGVLQQSLQHVVRLELGLTTRPDAIHHPWDLIIQQRDHAPRRLPPGTDIQQVFQQLGEELLILGAPGSGKTTLVIELAQSLLAKAEHDPNEPVPVILNLSSWRSPQRLAIATRNRSLLAEWLVAELRERYNIPRKVGEAWVDNARILPLLDGLDEVPAVHRPLCVNAINDFRQEHGLLSIVVCSRIADYEALAMPLRLQGAVEIQPLNRDQIDGYLDQIGGQLTGVRIAVHQDDTLWTLLETPLMLGIATLAYRDMPASSLLGLTDQRRWKQLFDAYIDAMFKRRTGNVLYSQEDTMAWLTWVAKSLALRGQSAFYLRWIQPDWLPTMWQRWVVTTGVAWLLGIGSAAVFGFLTERIWGGLAGVAAACFGFIVGLAFGHDEEIAPGEGRFLNWFSVIGRVASVSGLLAGTLATLLGDIRSGFVVATISATCLLYLLFLGDGGRGYLQHAIVRILLAWNGVAPWRYVQFLDYAVERILLRKIGDDYAFLHRLLVEHLADYNTPASVQPQSHHPLDHLFAPSAHEAKSAAADVSKTGKPD